MKISESKKQLAKIISENDGWIAGNFAAQQDDGEVWFSEVKPVWKTRCGTFDMGYEGHFTIGHLITNRHQTILSRDEYFHLYPVPDAVDEEPEHAWTNPPTIEQLAAEYRNRQDYAERKQQEADEAKAEAEAKLAELVAAGKAVGLVVSVSAPEPELVITDWRYLQVGDVVAITSVFGRDNSGYEHLIDREAVVVEVGNTEFQGLVVDRHGIEVHVDGFRFIRRPSKEADNA